MLDAALAPLADADLERTVAIRQQPMTVHAALARSLAHLAYHVGQIVLLARIHAGKNRGGSRSASHARRGPWKLTALLSSRASAASRAESALLRE